MLDGHIMMQCSGMVEEARTQDSVLPGTSSSSLGSLKPAESKDTVKEETISRSFEGGHYEAKVTAVTRVIGGIPKDQGFLKHVFSFILA